MLGDMKGRDDDVDEEGEKKDILIVYKGISR